MEEFQTIIGSGRIGITLQARNLGNDLVVHIYNENAHIGAVAVGEYDQKSQRASVSVHTRLAHKDDVVAQKAAYTISKLLQKTVCVIAGIHIDNITQDEINQVLTNADQAVADFIDHYTSSPR